MDGHNDNQVLRYVQVRAVPIGDRAGLWRVVAEVTG